MDKSKFDKIDFPENRYIVYYLFFKTKNGDEIPIYVGETSRNVGRFGDYVSRQFSGETDFKVGEAVSYLQEKKFPVSIRYRKSDKIKSERVKDQNKLMAEVKHPKCELLNGRLGFKYKEADKDKIRKDIREFIDGILRELES